MKSASERMAVLLHSTEKPSRQPIAPWKTLPGVRVALQTSVWALVPVVALSTLEGTPVPLVLMAETR